MKRKPGQALLLWLGLMLSLAVLSAIVGLAMLRVALQGVPGEATATVAPPVSVLFYFGEIVTDRSPVYWGIGEQNEPFGYLLRGDTFYVLGRQDDWFRIRTDRFDGDVWVSARTVGERVSWLPTPTFLPTSSPTPTFLPTSSPTPTRSVPPLATPTATEPPADLAARTRTPTATPADRSPPTATATPTLIAPSATPTTASTPTLIAPSATPTTASTSTVSPTPVPQPVAPALLGPFSGIEYPNPLTFRWSGTLNPGEAFQIVLTYPKTGEQIRSGPLGVTEWTGDLPKHMVGEWRWTVRVIKEGRVLAVSDEWFFWLNPHTGTGPGPQPLPTRGHPGTKASPPLVAPTPTSRPRAWPNSL